MNIRLFLLNAHHLSLHDFNKLDGLDRVDFAAHFAIQAIKIGFKNSTFLRKVLSLKVVHLPIACQSERSLRYFHLNRIRFVRYSSLEFPCATTAEKIFVA